DAPRRLAVYLRVDLGDAQLGVAEDGLGGFQAVALPDLRPRTVPQLQRAPDRDSRLEAGAADRPAVARHVVAAADGGPLGGSLLLGLVFDVRRVQRRLPLQPPRRAALLFGPGGVEEEVADVEGEEGLEDGLNPRTEEDDALAVGVVAVVPVLGLVSPRPVLP